MARLMRNTPKKRELLTEKRESERAGERSKSGISRHEFSIKNYCNENEAAPANVSVGSFLLVIHSMALIFNMYYFYAI